MNVKTFTFNPFQENTFILYDNSQECIIIDPGCYEQNEKKELIEFIESNELQPVKIINTHCHIDHILGNSYLAKKWGVELLLHEKEIPILKGSQEIANIYGMNEYENSPMPKYFLKDGDTVSFGKTECSVLFTPGHSPGHICLYHAATNILIAGDVIFQGSIGRTDLPGGDFDILIDSITKKIFRLPDETQIYCGHGPVTNLGFEKDHNPFLQ